MSLRFFQFPTELLFDAKPKLLQLRPNLRKQIRTAVLAHFPKFIEDARNELNMLNDRIKRKFKKTGMVIIFDSIEKLGVATTSNWKQVLDSAEQVFSGGMPYIRLPVDVIYTAPALTTRIKGIEFMPMIKVREKADRNKAYDPGIRACFEIIRKRAPDPILNEIFGKDQMTDRVTRLILFSGGYTREIIRMIRMAIAEKHHPLSDAAVNRILQQIANEYRHVVYEQDFTWLAKVAQTQYAILIDENHRQIVDRMLKNQAVLHYLNDEHWADLHPAVYLIPGVQEAICDLENQTRWRTL